MVKSLVLSILSVGLIGAPSVQNERAVIYDDNAYKITLTAEELNNYQWSNLFDFMNSESEASNIGSISSYNNYNLMTTYFTNRGGTYNYRTVYLSWSYGGQYSGEIHLDDTYHFVYSFTYEPNVSTFEYSLILGCGSAYYDDVKSAIELDIQANTIDDNDDMPSVSDLFGYITQGVTNFVQSLGQAFQSVTALFWTTGDNAGPTFVGLLMLVAIGAGLIYLAYNVIKGLIRRLRG